jgi:hypothetical protein
MIKELLLNTPEKYWIIAFGYHLHKSFFGVLFLLASFIVFLFYWRKFPSKRYLMYVCLALFGVGALLVLLSIFGHIYTHNLPYFKLWDKY